MIYFKKRIRYKYTLLADYHHQTERFPKEPIAVASIISLDTDGLLIIKKGYASDGPSGPAIDTRSFMRGSLVHDAFYQLLREEKLLPKENHEEFRKYADDLLREICIKDDMSKISAWLVHRAVRIFGASSAAPDKLQAP